jgi:hypothetical protein
MNRTGKVVAAFLAILVVTCAFRAQDLVKTLSVDVDVVLIPPQSQMIAASTSQASKKRISRFLKTEFSKK